MNQKISENNIKTWNNSKIREKRKLGMHIYHWGKTSYKQYYEENIKPLILEGITCSQMWSKGILDKTPPTLKKISIQHANENELNLIKENTKKGKAIRGLSIKGKVSPLKGKTYEEILGSKEKALQRSNITSAWMKQPHRNIRKYCTKVSKPQKMLFDIIKNIYPQAELEYNKVVKLDGSPLFLDIAIPDLKIDIEYDGIYWHDINNKKHVKKAKMNDKERDKYLTGLGWKVYRFQYYHNPSAEELLEKVKYSSII